MGYERLFPLFALIFGIASSASGGDVTLSVSSTLVWAVHGETVIVSCKASPESEESVIWERPGAGIISGSKQSNVFSFLESGLLKLVIRKASLEDEGIYNCRESSESSEFERAFFILQVSGPPKFDTTFEEVTLRKGWNITLFCNATGDPSPDYTWLDQNSRKIGSEISWDGDPKMAISSYLYLYEVTENSNGYFTCKANNTLGMETKIFQVTVLSGDYPPIFRNSSEAYYVNRNDSVVLTCQAEGEPSPMYTWKKDGYVLDYFSLFNNSRIEISRDNTALTVTNLRPEDSGNYTCVASNYLGEDTKYYQIFVSGGRDGYPPFFRNSSENHYVVRSDYVVLTCEAEGEPSPRYTWNKVGYGPDYLRFANNSRIEYRRNSTRLIFADISTGDSGNYTCVANNYLGKATKTFEIFVADGIGDYRPFFIISSEEHYVPENNSLVLTCEAEGEPNPRYEWKKDGYGLDYFNRFNNSRIEISRNNTRLTVSNLRPEDSGNYTCVASNYLGKATKNFQIFVSGGKDPEPLVDGTMILTAVKNVSQTSVTFELEAMNMGAFEGFNALFKNEGLFGWNYGSANWTFGEEYTVGSLIPGATYYFRFSVFPTGGFLWSEYINVTLPLQRPEIIFQEISSQKVKIQAFEPFDVTSSKSIDHYRLRYKTISMSGGRKWDYNSSCEMQIISPYPGCGSGFEVSGLQKNAWYYFVMESHNILGYSEPADFKIYVH